MPAGLKRASSAFLDSPVKPGNDGVGNSEVFIILETLNNSGGHYHFLQRMEWFRVSDFPSFS